MKRDEKGKKAIRTFVVLKCGKDGKNHPVKCVIKRKMKRKKKTGEKENMKKATEKKGAY